MALVTAELMRQTITEGLAMGNVVYLSQPDDFKSCTYFKNDEGKIGLQMRDESLAICNERNGEYSLTFHGAGQVYTREALAEFIQVAKILIDEQDRYMPNGELAAHNYVD